MPVAAFERDHSQSRLETARLAAAIPCDVGDVEVCGSDVGCEFRSFPASDRDRGAVGSGLPVVTYASHAVCQRRVFGETLRSIFSAGKARRNAIWDERACFKQVVWVRRESGPPDTICRCVAITRSRVGR